VFEVTFGDLRNPAAHKAFNKLGIASHYPDAKAAYRAAKLIKIFSDEAKVCDQVFVGILEKEGIPIKPDGTYEISDEKIAEWRAVYDDFCKTTATLHTDKLHIDDLPAGISPLEIIALEPMLVLESK